MSSALPCLAWPRRQVFTTGIIMMPCGIHLSHHEHRQVITTGELMCTCIVKSGDRQVPKTGIVIVHSPSSPETGKLSLPETGTVTVAQSFIHRQVKSSCG